MKSVTVKISVALALTLAFVIISCTKNVPSDMTNKKTPVPMTNGQMPNDSIHRNLQKNDQNTGQNQTETEGKGDEKADQVQKDADDADAKYMKTKSDADKKVAIEKQLSAANYLMFEANLSPKKKYKPALKRYRRVLELDPGNKEAQDNKQQIEDIYQSMGMPVPD
jgi:tetratricopeptide (TPR) repeat protein